MKAGRAWRQGGSIDGKRPRTQSPNQPDCATLPTQDDQFQLLAHDVRNHVVAVERNLELLQQGIAGPVTESQVEILQATRDCARLLLGITSDILDLSRFERGRLHLALSGFNLVEVITTSVRLCRGAGIDKGIRIGLDLRCGPVMVLADRFRIVRVLVNLLMNAIEFSPPGGTVMVTCSECEKDGIVVAVTDEGPGIAREHQRRVFQKYYRVSGNGAPSRPGLGLGLYFCKRTIVAHDGWIWVESPVPGQENGTRVLFTLPRAESGGNA